MLNKIQDIMTSKIVSNVDAGLLFCKNDEYSTILYANDYFFSMIGYTREEVEELFQNRFALMVVDDVSEILKDVDATIKQGKNLDFEYRMRKKDGSIIWIHDTAAYEKETNTFYVVLMDITEKKTIQYQMQKLLTILEHIPNKILIADLNKKIEYINIAGEENPYIKDLDGKTLDLEEVISPFIIGQSFHELWERALNQEIVSYETRKKSNHTIIAHDKNYLIPLVDHTEQIMNIMQVSEDLMRQNDSLTGMPNRGMFERYYNQQKDLAEGDFSVALCIIDIDDFKAINDNYGHAAGDFVIKSMARFLIDLLEEGDYVSRYGGDEFVFLIKNDTYRRLEVMLNKIMNFAKEKIIWNNSSFYATYSLGIAMTNGKVMQYHTLFQNADIALYKAKYNGKNTYAIYQDNILMTWLSKQYDIKSLMEYLKEKEIFEFIPYGTQKLNQNMIKVHYRLEEFPEEIRQLLVEGGNTFEKYITDEIFEALGLKILQRFLELKQETESKLCVEIPLQFLLEKQFFILLDEVMEEYQAIKNDIVFKIIGKKELFEKSNIEKIYSQFMKREYQVIIGDFGNQVTSYEILMEFPTNYISVEQDFLEKSQCDTKYKIVWNMIEQFIKIENITLLISE